MDVKVNLDSAIIYRDLEDALSELETERQSPKQVRRLFYRFVDLTQRLTSAMRKDFSRIKSTHWNSSAFSGWNNVTTFFKWLRNEDQHNLPIFVSVHERRFYEVASIPGKPFIFEGTWTLSDQMTEAPPNGMTFYPIDPKTGNFADIATEPLRIEYQFLLQPRTDEAKSQIASVGTSDIHKLSRACFNILAQYYKYFEQQILK